MKATKIKMKPGCHYSDDLCEIDSIYLDSKGCFVKKEQIYNYLLKNPCSIYVDLFPFPYLEPVISIYGEKYVRSKANYTMKDNLLRLPRE